MNAAPDADATLTVPALSPSVPRHAVTTPLLVCDDDVLTYARGRATVGRAGQGPARRRASARAPTSGCCTRTEAAFVVAWLAAARIGAVTLPLSTLSTSGELRVLLRNADIEVLLADAARTVGATTSTDLQDAVPGFDPSADVR